MSPPVGGAGGREARPGFRTRARRWNLALCVAVVVAAMVALPVPSGASSEEVVERAISLVAEGRLGEARELLDPVLDLGAARPRARLLDGILLAREGHVDQAIEVFEQLRRDHPEMPEPWNNLAVLFAVKGRLLDARNALEEALARKPDLAAAHANLGDVYAALARHSRTNAQALGPAAGGASPGEGAGALRLPKPEEPSAPVVSAPSRPGPAAEVASSPAMAGSRELATPASGGAAGADGSQLLAKPESARRDQWQSFLSLPGTSARAPAAAAPASARTAAPAASAAPPAEHDSSREAGSAPFTCFVASGFESPQAAAEAEAWLLARGVHEIDTRRKESSAPRNHRVYLPPLESRAAAIKVVYELRDRGVRDVAIISAGPLRNGVSLGVYRNAKNALRRVARIEALGYSVRHAPGETGKAGYALAARSSPDAFLPLRAAWRERFPDRSLEPADCD